MTRDIVVEAKNLEKSFAKVYANKNISFKLKKGNIYALLGENGAGKSTLMNMLSGIYRPDSGHIYIHGKKTQLRSPKDAIKNGIGMIHQHFKLVDNLSAMENIILGHEKSFFLNRKHLISELKDFIVKFSLDIDVEKKVSQMSVSEKQSLEILKVLYRGADIMILDEPTAVLTPQEVRHLFKILKKLQDDGCTIIIITHKLQEILEISDEVLIMRKGEMVADVVTENTSEKELTDLMVGESVDLKIERANVEKGSKILEIKNLIIYDEENVKKIKEISFDLHAGEILGIAGLAGSGQKELCEAINGLQNISQGSIVYEGENIVGMSPRKISEKGIALSFVPEDRLGMGLVSSMSMIDNMILKNYYKQPGFFLRRRDASEKSKKLIDKLRIVTPDEKHPVRQLSGGNIQKILLGRELDSQPHLLIVAYPTRGLDISSSHLIYDLINEQKRKGIGTIYVGEDLDVLMEISDRIMVVCDGENTGIVDAKTTTKEELGFMMAGKKLEEIRAASKN